MKRGATLVLLICVLVATVTVGASAGGTSTPILTGAGNVRSSEGFGKIRPSTIYLGGDPTGLVCHIRWLSWGGQFAIGTGTGFYEGPNQAVAAGHQAPAVVVLSRLGTWHGRRAYTKFNWYFPQNGSTSGGVTHCSA
jgi:hypothetical protein